MKWALFGVAIISQSIAAGQSRASVPAEILSYRPLDDATQLLERIYGKVITYEEPVLVWSGDLVPSTPWLDRNHKWGVIPKSYGLALPAEAGTDRDMPSVLEKVIAANNAQPIGARFRLLTSKWGYHVVPIESHNANGLLVEAHSVLDFTIDVPMANRTPMQHMQQLMAAIKSASGISMDFWIFGSPQRFNNQFPGRQASYEWGVARISGRDALIDFLDKSKMTWSWSLRCQPSALAEDSYCSLNWRY